METPVLVPDSECPRCRELEARLVVLEAKLRDLEDVIRVLKGGPPPRREGEPIAPPAAKTPTGKKPGGQKGHKPHKRPWLPKERVTATVAFVPTQCEHCDHALPAAAQPGDPAPTIHQTYELPQQLIDVTQYEGHSRTCPGCGFLCPFAESVEFGFLLRVFFNVLFLHGVVFTHDEQEDRKAESLGFVELQLGN